MSNVLYRPQGRAGEYSEWALNLYGGCCHGCTYCYVPGVRKLDRCRFYEKVYAYPDVMKKLRLDCSLLARRVTTPVLLSFTSDAYQPAGEYEDVTREAVTTLKGYGLAVCILTKGGLRATRDFDLLEPGRDVIAATLTFVDPAQSLQWEPLAALPADRIELLRQAKARGLQTWASLEPVIDPAQTLAAIDASHQWVDLYKVGRLNYHKIAAQTEWREFAAAVTERFSRYGVAWYIKDDLMPFMPPGFPQRGGGKA